MRKVSNLPNPGASLLLRVQTSGLRHSKTSEIFEIPVLLLGTYHSFSQNLWNKQNGDKYNKQVEQSWVRYIQKLSDFDVQVLKIWSITETNSYISP